MKRILFQGDSITDAGRIRERLDSLGLGYPSKVASKMGFDKPGEYEFINKGISGDRVVDLYARIKRDIINLKPDYMSVMIGVNDVWHELDFLQNNGVDAVKYEKIYDMLLSEVLEALPDIKIMIIEPYVLCESGTQGTLDDGTDKYTTFRLEVEKRAQAAKRLAEKYSLVFIPLQKKLDELAKIQPVAYWTPDGVHPTNVGHEFIAREWIKYFEENF